ncbi:MAG: hypothetical protein M1818_001279 [Claussenomyces sp. TS43310]|nr:MAG: hypothetical protein M1818_001279 [Claussenomyces sp. TS43310]
MDEEDVAELSPLEYARKHGLAIDHLAESLPWDHIHALQESSSEILPTDSHLPQIKAAPSFYTAERLTVDKGAAKLLTDANRIISTAEENSSFITPLLDVRKIRDLRVEVPLLRSDHEADCRAFAKRQDTKSDLNLPVDTLDDERDEGLGWPAAIKALPGQVIEEMKTAKLEVARKSLIYLQDLLKNSWTVEDEEKVWESEAKRDQKTCFEKVTPPLLPASPPLIPYIPSSPACYLPLLSDPSFLNEEDLERAERDILREKLTTPTVNVEATKPSCTTGSEDNVTALDPNSPSTYLKNSLSSPIITQAKARDLKIEVPLMPLTPTTATKKVVTFDPNIELVRDSLRMHSSSNSSLASTDEQLETSLKDTFGPIGETIMQRLEQEHLQEADSTQRVVVRVMDFAKPDPPWKQSQLICAKVGATKAQRVMIENAMQESGIPNTWPGTQKTKHLLCWVPFSAQFVKEFPHEVIAHDEELHKFISVANADEVIDSDGVTWKPPGLRILKEDDDEDEEELEGGPIPEKLQDLTALIKKRKTQFEEDDESLQSLRKADLRTFNRSLVKNPRLNLLGGFETGKEIIARGNQTLRHDMGRLDTRNLHSSLDDPFSAATALDNFLEMQGSKKQKLLGSKYFSDISASDGPPWLDLRAAKPQPLPSEAVETTLPTPSINPPDISTPIIISLLLMRRRSLIRTMSTLFPSIILIERDFSAHNTIAWNPGSVSRSPISSPLVDEADLIISPSTGIILTTLQKIKQKPLPGHKTKAEIQARLERVSTRYERLIVLISAASTSPSPSPTTTTTLTSSDCLALTAFTGFCASLETSTTVHFIPDSSGSGDGDDILATWLTAAIIRYGGAREGLLQDETMWELFLRRVGLNAFAAQTLLALLKAPDGVDAATPCKAGLFGLTAFVDLDARERLRRFEALLGGPRVLTRVSAALEQSWR